MSKLFKLKDRAKGVIVPLVTWLDSNGNVDHVAMEQHIDFLLKKGANVIFTLGSTGEGPYRTMDEKKEIIDHVVNHVNDRVPVLTGAAYHGVREAIQFCEIAAEKGVDGVVVNIPQYFNLSATDVDLYFTKLAEGIGDAIPVCIYYAPTIITNMPKIGPDLVFELARRKAIAGIKYTINEWEDVAELCRMRADDYTVQMNNIWCGTDKVAMDCLKNDVTDFDGIISSAANLFPDFYNVLLKAFRESPRNDARCKSLENISIIIQKMFQVDMREIPALMKVALNSAKMPFANCVDVSPPLPGLRPEIEENLMSCLAELRKKGINIKA
ncbi:MAG TPA: dihydrodipicolinate synthase family protein [Candidatus Lokiarchaeia archaeon]|nr:dihydrodipicolinate synthase family protein [Candidatus Lokiarchaeia archaeon]